jgi:hypothetical protein
MVQGNASRAWEDFRGDDTRGLTVAGIPACRGGA